jgi:nitrite reductase (NADH) large subunit
MSTRTLWRTICALNEILPDTGVAALVAGRQVAIFRVGESEELYALGNRDPFSGAHVLARGLIGDLGGELVVASPVYKQHFKLRDGVCLEDPAIAVPIYPVRAFNGAVQVGMAVEAMPRHARQRLVMIGNGMAGMRVIEDLLRIAPERYDITIFGDEPHGNYNRVLLSSVLAGEKREQDVMLHPPQWYAQQGLVLHADDRVVAIDRRKRIVRSRSGFEAPYDRLLLAVGSSPRHLQIRGSDFPGVLTFRNLEDVAALLDAAKSRRRAVVIGGGLLGLEAAQGLKLRGMDVTVVHSGKVLMERQLDAYSADQLRALMELRGIRFVLGAKTTAIEGEGAVDGVRFADGSAIPADLVVVTAGIVPNIALARSAGLHCDRGIVVDDTMQTYDPRVYAVGECAQHRGVCYGLVAPLYEQARVCAAHLAGSGHLRYIGSAVATSLKVTGIELYSAGDIAGGSGCEELVLRDPEAGIYKRLVVRDRRIVGALMFGDARDGAWYYELMREGRDIGALRDRLLFGRTAAELSAAA